MDGIIRIWDVQTGHLVEHLRGHGKAVCSVAFMPDDRGLVSGSDDKKIKRWDLTPFLECDARTEPLPSASCSERSTDVPVKEGGERGSICTLTFDGHKDWVRSLAVGHDGQWLASGSEEKSVLFWDVQNAQLQFALHGHQSWVFSVDMSPTEDFFATGDGLGTTRICELFFRIYNALPNANASREVQTYRS